MQTLGCKRQGAMSFRSPRYGSCRNKRSLYVAASEGNGGSPGKSTIHKLIEQEGILLVPGCHDALSAKVLQSAGHKAAYVSGYAVSATLLGEPDLGLLTSPEMARKAGQIHYAVPTLPVIADADTGGGNVLNVQRTIQQLISAGCKGCVMEDQVWPKKAGHMRNKEVISMGEFAAKIYAAKEAVGSADFFLVARTDARGTSAKYGLEDAITRANLYAEAGADATYIEAPRSDEELAEIGERTKGIKVCNMLEGGITPLHTPDEMKALGFSVMVVPLAGLYAASKAYLDVYNTLKISGTTRDVLGRLSDFNEFNELVGYEERIAVEERLTRSKGPEKLHVRVRGTTRPAPSSPWPRSSPAAATPSQQ